MTSDNPAQLDLGVAQLDKVRGMATQAETSRHQVVMQDHLEAATGKVVKVDKEEITNQMMGQTEVAATDNRWEHLVLVKTNKEILVGQVQVSEIQALVTN